MKTFQLIAFIFLFSLSSWAATNSLDSIETLEEYFEQEDINPEKIKEGLYVNITKRGSGAVPKTGDYVKVKFIGKLLNGKVFDQSEKDFPFVYQSGYRQVIKGWELGMSKFKVGGKGQLFVNPEYGFGKSSIGSVPGNSALVYDIELLEIMDIDSYDKYMVALDEKERIAFEKEKEKQFIQDKKLIQDYVLKSKIKTKRLPSGLSYSVKKKGKGSFPDKGDKVTVHYESYFANGEKFDSSFGKKPYTFELGKRQALKAWQEGIKYFNKGSEGWLLLPSKLGYGSEPVNGEGWFIPGNSVLIFKIKVLSIEKSQMTSSK